jgi:HTH-type transcriptional regulator, competence development regulator
VASAFGIFLKRLRERRVPSLSLRQFAQLCVVDHAYIHRLETGEKEAPSEETLASLLSVLKPVKQEERILRFLAGRNLDLSLVDPSIVDDPSLILEHFETVATMSFRGTRPTTAAEWRKKIDRMKLYDEDDDE